MGILLYHCIQHSAWNILDTQKRVNNPNIAECLQLTLLGKLPRLLPRSLKPPKKLLFGISSLVPQEQWLLIFLVFKLFWKAFSQVSDSA